MAFVLDASVVLAWLLPDEKSDVADRIIGRVADDRVVAPSLLLLEVGNALLQAQRRGWIAAALRQELIEAFTTLPIMLEPVSADPVRRAGEIAGDQALSLYDACYLELALTRNCPLATFDNGLIRASQAMGVPIIDGD
jgi:predicted nucleic acid-binding protein